MAQCWLRALLTRLQRLGQADHVPVEGAESGAGIDLDLGLEHRMVDQRLDLLPGLLRDQGRRVELGLRRPFLVDHVAVDEGPTVVVKAVLVPLSA
jgi:hypothetical protein